MTAKRAGKASGSAKKKSVRAGVQRGKTRVELAPANVAAVVKVPALETEAPAKPKKKPVRNIQKYADIETRRAFPDICTGLIEKARTGAIGQTKILMKISGLDEKRPAAGAKRRGKSLSAILLEELEKSRTSEGAVAGGAGAGNAAAVEVAVQPEPCALAEATSIE